MDRKDDGPTVFDINKPRTFGASASSRPIITGHQPTMPDPMVRTSGGSGVKINVNSGHDQQDTDTQKLADSLFPSAEKPPKPDAADYDRQFITPPEPRHTQAPATGDFNSLNKSTANDPMPGFFDNGDNQTKEKKVHKERRSGSKFTKILLWLALLLVLAGGVYGAIDKGIILSSVDLPFHIFKESDPVEEATSPASGDSQAVVPTGFTGTKLVEANLSFVYPTAWGAPTANVEQGYSERKADAKPDASYAFVVDFPNNKDVQMVVTSGKHLPPTRASNAILYYDLLGWCLGTADAKYYVSVLRFSTSADKVDTPGTISCDQGPQPNVVKISNDTIVQTNIKNSEGGVLGDIYTKNLTDKTYVVAKIKDVAMKNGDLIKTMLENIKPL